MSFRNHCASPVQVWFQYNVLKYGLPSITYHKVHVATSEPTCTAKVAGSTLGPNVADELPELQSASNVPELDLVHCGNCIYDGCQDTNVCHMIVHHFGHPLCVNIAMCHL